MTASVLKAAMFSLMAWALPAAQGQPLLQAPALEHLQPSSAGGVFSSSESDESESESSSVRSRSRSRNQLRVSAASSQSPSGFGF